MVKNKLVGFETHINMIHFSLKSYRLFITVTKHSNIIFLAIISFESNITKSLAKTYNFFVKNIVF